MNTPLLAQLGMTPKEVKLYLKLLELGITGANNLARSIGENRTSTYSLLENMMKKGFVTVSRKGKVKQFFAANPELLINRFFNDAKGLKALLPELLAIQNRHPQKPKISFYEGLAGIKQIAEMLIEVPNSTRLSFMGIDYKKIHPEMRRYIENEFLEQRIERNIKFKGIVTGDIPHTKKYQASEKGHLRELKYIDRNVLPIVAHIDIFSKNRVAFFSYNKDELMGVVIESPAFYKTMQTAFALAWVGVDAFSKG